MLTGFQVERIAYAPEDFYGEFLCRRCALGVVDERGGDSQVVDDFTSWTGDDEYIFDHTGLEAWSRFSVEETARPLSEWDDEGIHEDCGCTEGVYCENCGEDIIEPFNDEYSHGPAGVES